VSTEHFYDRDVNQDNLTTHKMSHRLWIAIGFSPALLGLSAFWLTRQYDKYPRAYARLKSGANKAEVLGSYLDQRLPLEHFDHFYRIPIRGRHGRKTN
jgi:hypothetical protein